MENVGRLILYILYILFRITTTVRTKALFWSCYSLSLHFSYSLFKVIFNACKKSAGPLMKKKKVYKILYPLRIRFCPLLQLCETSCSATRSLPLIFMLLQNKSHFCKSSPFCQFHLIQLVSVLFGERLSTGLLSARRTKVCLREQHYIFTHIHLYRK